jgi:uncharacterized protein Yka (UPF0111/DUF47 family)
MKGFVEMSQISRKNVDYFEMFDTGMKIAYKAAVKLQAAFADGHIDEEELKQIKDIEHEGDLHVHQCIKTIDVAFITPIDRTDIVEIVKAIENLTDSIDAISARIFMLQITEADEYLVKFVSSLVLSCETLKEMMCELKQFKRNQKRIKECIIEVNRLEEVGDRTFMESMKNLFVHEKDAIKLVKQKDMYELLEDALDRAEDIADIVEKVIVAKT